jgi:hypothetical protein
MHPGGYIAGVGRDDRILRRLLGCSAAESEKSDVKPNGAGGGVFDARNGVQFPEGFEIFRTYKRREYVAYARAGTWLRKDDGRKYPTLNQLNASIASGAENVWNGNWKYRADDGSIHSINDLRR